MWRCLQAKVKASNLNMKVRFNSFPKVSSMRLTWGGVIKDMLVKVQPDGLYLSQYIQGKN